MKAGPKTVPWIFLNQWFFVRFSRIFWWFKRIFLWFKGIFWIFSNFFIVKNVFVIDDPSRRFTLREFRDALQGCGKRYRFRIGALYFPPGSVPRNNSRGCCKRKKTIERRDPGQAPERPHDRRNWREAGCDLRKWARRLRRPDGEHYNSMVRIKKKCKN